MFHLIESMGLEGSVRLIDKATHKEFGMDQTQYREVLRLFNGWRREIDPLCGMWDQPLTGM